MLLAHLLKLAVLFTLFGRKSQNLFFGAGGDLVFFHVNALLGGAAAACFSLRLRLRCRRRLPRDLLLRFAQRQTRNVVLRTRALSFADSTAALQTIHVTVLVVRWVLGGVVVLRIGSLGLGDLHGRGALLLGEVQVRLVPLEPLRRLGEAVGGT
ncbi:hypothetical protein TPAR_03932 [Tolypocladium paradoxum]|uniref:Uncharacterized protein n=1 Tax=Tolypocladium paradoxum TaxID=94208 RepID=A0A2S4L0A3_9HYPO|nr:hypothetical protein TPAR_03932 [Tolypocladium paradoxum]